MARSVGLVNDSSPPDDGKCCQAPQAPEDRHGSKYDNDTPDNWLRGKGMKPSFDYCDKRRA